MADDHESTNQLSIRCPACRQRFSVDEELMDRMVECGGCDTRFRINDEVIIRTRKFYPGERTSPQLNRFQRVPLSAAAPEGMQTMRYAEFNHPEQLGPASPQRVIAGIFGAALMVGTALVLIFSTAPGGAFNAMSMTGKLTVAGFVSLLGLVLLVYANPRGRRKAVFFGLLMAAGVVCIPFFIKGEPMVPGREGDPVADSKEPSFPETEADPAEKLRERFGTAPLEKEQTRLGEAGSETKAYGVYMKGLVERNKYTARDFLIRDTGAGPSSHPYPRDDGSYLMVLTGVSMDLDQVAEIAGKLGRVDEKYPELGVIEVTVGNNQFLAGSAEKLNDKNHPAFYELNMHELQSIDQDRIKTAVERLAEAEPKIYRDDISGLLVGLMLKPGMNFHKEIARALLKWDEGSGPASAAALTVLNKTVAAGGHPPEDLVELAVRSKSAEAVETVNRIWIKTPELWASKFVRLGPQIEPLVLTQLDSEDAPLRRSAIKLLEEIGTEKCLPALRKLLDAEDPEIRVLAERSVETISGR